MKCMKRGIRLTLNEFGKATVHWKKVISFTIYIRRTAYCAHEIKTLNITYIVGEFSII